MSNLIKDKLWEALEEAAKLRDMRLVLEATRIIQDMKASDEESGERQRQPNLSLVPYAQEEITLGMESVLGFTPRSRSEIIPYLVDNIMPKVKSKVGGNRFKRQHVVDELEEMTLLTEKEKNWIGYCLRQEMVEQNILEEPDGCFLRFTSEYLNIETNVSASASVNVSVTEMAQFFHLNVLPSLLKENQYYPVYTVDDICAYFVSNCGSYTAQQIKDNIDDVLSLLEEKRILEIQLDQVEIRHSINSKYVTADDLKQMLQKAV